ncbi:GAF domain-containing protein [Elusimicrobium simillimum]|uniref:GAF domain-containing protein n=1 Tax=Elusimicrobium simillimum TaxID=3143438 RepID=UPI003C706015
MNNLILQAQSLLANETDAVANMANLSALIFNSLDNINWAGFYILKDGVLVLGPFQGKTACVRINIGRGVCGEAAQKKQTIIVPDVHAHPDHIACDAASESEIVVPVIKDGVLYGVLDIDSPIKNRFSENEKELFENLVQIFTANSNLTR